MAARLAGHPVLSRLELFLVSWSSQIAAAALSTTTCKCRRTGSDCGWSSIPPDPTTKALRVRVQPGKS